MRIDASNCFEPRRKSIGNKRVDISAACRELIVRAYGEYVDKDYTETLSNGKEIICKSRVIDNVALGYNKITVESPALDENGNKVLKKGKPVADSSSGNDGLFQFYVFQEPADTIQPFYQYGRFHCIRRASDSRELQCNADLAMGRSDAECYNV